MIFGALAKMLTQLHRSILIRIVSALALFATFSNARVIRGVYEHKFGPAFEEDLLVDKKGSFRTHNAPMVHLQQGFENWGSVYLRADERFRPNKDLTDHPVCSITSEDRWSNTGQLEIDYPNVHLKTVLTSRNPFYNSGEIIVQHAGRKQECSKEPDYDKTYCELADISVISKSQINNQGLVTLAGEPDAPVVVDMSVQNNDPDEPLFINQGSICIANAQWELKSPVWGTGCIVAAANTEIVLNGDIRLLDDQIIYLSPQGSQSTIVYKGKGERDESYVVKGFAKHTFIDFKTPMAAYRYTSGKIWVRVLHTSPEVSFAIGPYYDRNKFIFTGHLITYEDELPFDAPKNCRCAGRYFISSVEDIPEPEIGWKTLAKPPRPGFFNSHSR